MIWKRPSSAKRARDLVHLRRMDEHAFDLADHADLADEDDAQRRIATRARTRRAAGRRRRARSAPAAARAGPSCVATISPMPPGSTGSPLSGSRNSQNRSRACRCMPSCDAALAGERADLRFAAMIEQLDAEHLSAGRGAAAASAPRRWRSRRGSADHGAGRVPSAAPCRRGWRGSSACRHTRSPARRVRLPLAAGWRRCRR